MPQESKYFLLPSSELGPDVVDPPLGRDALEHIWRQRLNAEFNRFYQALEVTREVRSAVSPQSGPFAILKALEAEQAARNEYMRVLRVYTDFFIFG